MKVRPLLNLHASIIDTIYNVYNTVLLFIFLFRFLLSLQMKETNWLIIRCDTVVLT